MPTARGVPFSTGSSRRWPRYVVWVAVLAIGGLAAYEIYWSERAAPSPAPALTAAAPTKPAPSAPTSVAPAPVASEARSEAEPRASEPAPQPEPAAPLQAPAAAPPEQALLRFVFRRDSWVEVREADGRVIFTRLNAAGTEEQVTGKPPFSLVIGNASGVLLRYGDRAVELEPHIVGGGVARLTLK